MGCTTYSIESELKILHTSDWHLGRQLFGRKRYPEFEAFLNWLGDVVEQQGIEALLVAGDVFDTNTPSNRAQELYYQFLCRMASSATCRHVVIIAGNHDSPSFLDAPKALLKALQVHVIGQASRAPEDPNAGCVSCASASTPAWWRPQSAPAKATSRCATLPKPTTCKR